MPKAPVAPVAIVATLPTQTSFTANWNAVASVTGYYIDVATDNLFVSILSSYNHLLVSTTSLNVIGLIPATTYYYRVKSTNSSGTSTSSNTISTLTIPITPIAVSATAPTQTSFTSKWNVVTGAASYYVDVATDNLFASILPNHANQLVSGTSLDITGLIPGTSYYYRIRSANASGISPSSNTISTLTIPTTPTAAATSAATQTSFTANWNIVIGATGYYIDVATDNSFVSILTNYSHLLMSGTSHDITGLIPATIYYYRIKSTNSSGTSSSSNTISALTIPTTPTAAAANGPTQTSFISNWSAIIGATGYYIDVATDNSFASILPNYNQLLVLSNSPYISGLISGNTFYYRVRSANPSGISPSSNTISALTIPATPAALSPSAVTQTSLTVNWNVVTGATVYYVDVATDNLFASILPNHTNQLVSSTSLDITGLTPGTSYDYRIRSANASGISPSSNIISALTLPTTPTAASASAPTQTSFTANWNIVTGATGYYIDVATDNSFVSFLPNYTSQLVSGISLNIIELTPGTSFYYRIRSANVSGISPPSNTISALTIPPTPTAAAASHSTQTSFISNWNAVSGSTGYYIDVATDNSFASTLPNYTDQFVSGTLLDITGLVQGATYSYRIRSANASGSSPSSNIISVTPALGNSVAYDIFFPTGGTPTDYRIVSIPRLTGTTLTTGLSDGSYQKNWRIMHWDGQQKKNVDMKEITQLISGNGYWVNANLNPAPSIHVTGATLFTGSTLTLQPGWNQIGNPIYDFDISWADVLAQNSAVTGIGKLYTYNVPAVSPTQPFQQYDGLLTWGGGFVNNINTSAVQLNIPTSIKKFNGRISSPSNFTSSSELTAAEWFVPITLQVGNSTNNLAGFGMHPEASKSIDSFDAIVLPHFYTYVDLVSTHPEFFQPSFMGDVVPTSSNYDWSFSASSNNEDQNASLRWSNTSFGNGNSKLFLFDETNSTLLDMKKNDSYSFQLDGPHNFHFFFSANGELAPDITGMSAPYPNPFTSEITIPFITNEENENVQIYLYETSGRQMRTLHNGAIGIGYHEIKWDGSDDQGARIAQGIYIIRFISSSSVRNSKIIFK